MTTGVGALFLHLWLVVGLATLGAGFFMAAAQPMLFKALTCFNNAARQQFLWCMALFPYAVGIYVAILVLAPLMSYELGFVLDHRHFELQHGHIHWLSWQGLGVIMLTGVAGWKLLALLWRRAQQNRYLATLLAFSEIDERGYHRVDSDIPNAFTVGLMNPQILLSKALENALTTRELDIVYRHEQAHLDARDPLRLWLFGVLLGTFIPPARRALYSTMELLIEQQADAAVARALNDSTLIANTLVKVNRLMLRHQHQPPQVHACGFSTNAIEQRVRQLLYRDQGRIFPIPGFLLGTVTLVCIGIYYAKTLHHTIDILLHYHP